MRHFTLLALFTLFVVPMVAEAQQSPPQKTASIEGVTEYRLANGARVVLFPEPTKPTITVNMTVLVGSRHEGYGEAGMAHLLEHMVFKGTPTFPDIPTALRDHGATANGSTNHDRTNYFETLPATDQNLEFAIKLESDRLVNSYIKEEHLRLEFSVVRNEFERGENNPQRVLFRRVIAAAYDWHNYGKATIGNRSDIERVPVESLRAFYRKYYQPDNMVLIVTGRFKEARALELVNTYLGSIPRPERKLSASYTIEPPQDGERRVELRRVGQIGATMAAYHVPAAAHEDWAPLSILASVISENKVGLLQEKLVETNNAISVSAEIDNAHDPGLFSVSVQPTEGRLQQAHDVMIKAMDELPDEIFTEESIGRAKKRAANSAEQLSFDANQMSRALSRSASRGDWRLLFIQRDRVQQVTVEDVKRVARTYFPDYNRTVGTFVPAQQPKRAYVPLVASLAKLVDDYKGGAALETGEAFDATPENLAARLQTAELHSLKVGLLQKRNRGNTVVMTLNLRYGNEDSLRAKTTAAGLVSSMLMAGTETMDRQALQAAMTELGVRIGPGGGQSGGRGRRAPESGQSGVGSLSFSISAKRDSLLPAIELLGQILRQPAFPTDYFQQTKMRRVGGVRRLLDDPQTKANNLIARTLSPYPYGDVRYVPTAQQRIERIDSMTLDVVKQLYTNQIGATTGEIAIVGDFDKDAALTALDGILKGWNTDVEYRSIDRHARTDVVGMKQTIITPDKANATLMVGLAFELSDTDPDCEALLLGNYIFGGSRSSRIYRRLRRQEGLSYQVGASISVPSRGADARFTINANTNPININAAEKAALEELERFLAEGPTETEVADAKYAWLERQKVSRSSDGQIASQIVSNLALDRTFEFQSRREERISGLTVAEIHDAFRKYIDPNKLVIVRAGDLPE